MPSVKKKVGIKELKKIWEDCLNGIMPKDERVFLSDPKFAYLYAKYFRKKRWDEKDEIIFYKDIKVAYLYSIFLCDNVPEHIHNFMLAKNLEDLTDSDKKFVNEYFDYLKKKR